MSSVSSPLMHRFNIGTRVLAGFIAVLLLLATLAGVSVTGFRSATGAFGSFDTIAHNTLTVGTIDRTIVTLRRDAYIFTSSGDEAAAKHFRETVPGLRTDIAKAVAATRNPERRAKLAEAGTLADGYAANFDKAATMRVARDKLVNEKLNVLGGEARQHLSQVIASAMTDGDMEAAALAGQPRRR